MADRGKKKSWKTKEKIMDCMSEDIRELNINQEDAMDRLAWKAKARKADPRHKKRQMEKKIGFFFRLNFIF